jgi:hypothetical protein
MADKKLADILLPVYNEEHVLEKSITTLRKFLQDNVTILTGLLLLAIMPLLTAHCRSPGNWKNGLKMCGCFTWTKKAGGEW